MTITNLQKGFAPFKKLLPPFLSNFIRSFCTAILTPIIFSYNTGHFKSSFKMMAVSKDGKPLPWYTYPSIDFLKSRSYKDKSVLEFGGGQSTLWWAERANSVVAIEGDNKWFERYKRIIPANVSLYKVSMESSATCVSQVKEILNKEKFKKFDVIIIDGLYRFEMIEIAIKFMSDDGVIICDNSEGYGFYEGFKNSGLQRVDFFGNAPGVILPHCTSVFLIKILLYLIR